MSKNKSSDLSLFWAKCQDKFIPKFPLANKYLSIGLLCSVKGTFIVLLYRNVQTQKRTKKLTKHRMKTRMIDDTFLNMSVF